MSALADFRWSRRTLAGAIVALVATLLLAAASRVPWSADPHDSAMLRLAWRYASEYVEECRTVPPEELEQLPVHMRRPVVCDGRLMPYRLEVRIDGHVVMDEWSRGAGARQDRPLSVMRELRLAPGDYHVEVSWTPERAGQRPAQSVDAILRLEAGEVALITYDVDARRMVARGRMGGSGSARLAPTRPAPAPRRTSGSR
jgi:hypothetical protein